VDNLRSNSAMQVVALIDRIALKEYNIFRITMAVYDQKKIYI
jgi:hypothetical protein